MSDRRGVEPEQVLRDMERDVPTESIWTKTDTGAIHKIIGHTILTDTGQPLVGHYDMLRPELKLSTPGRAFLGNVAVGDSDAEPLFRPVSGSFRASGN